MSTLKAETIHKRYGKNHVLSGASLDVEGGTVVGLVGENGAGKSTFLKIVVGLLKPDDGHLQTARRTGYCPQDAVLFDALTMDENVAYFAAGYGIDQAQAIAAARNLMARLNCEHFASQRVGQLSGGTKQKLNLVLALFHRPDLLVLDEPYQGFDYESYLAFWDLANEIRAEGRSAVIVSHMLVDQDKLDRVYKLADGKIHQR